MELKLNIIQVVTIQLFINPKKEHIVIFPIQLTRITFDMRTDVAWKIIFPLIKSKIGLDKRLLFQIMLQ